MVETAPFFRRNLPALLLLLSAINIFRSTSVNKDTFQNSTIQLEDNAKTERRRKERDRLDLRSGLEGGVVLFNLAVRSGGRKLRTQYQ